MANARSNSRRGFTLIEVLVTIGIIVILAGMLFVGLRFSSAKAKKDSTRTALQTLRGMYTEREVSVGATQNKQDFDTIYGFNATTSTAATPVPAIVSSVHVALDPDMPSRTTSSAVTNTILAMGKLLTVPANKTVMGQFSGKALLEGLPVNPVLLDGYGDPIIFCPSTGLSNVSLNGGTTQTIRSPDGKPFFVSAGPDGDLSTGDDNIYSFEN